MSVHGRGNDENTGHNTDHVEEDEKFFMSKIKSVVLAKLLSEVRGIPFGGEFRGGPPGESEDGEEMATIQETQTVPVSKVPGILKEKGVKVPDDLKKRLKKLRSK